MWALTPCRYEPDRNPLTQFRCDQRARGSGVGLRTSSFPPVFIEEVCGDVSLHVCIRSRHSRRAACSRNQDIYEA
jgi:hypothetical protein